MKLRVDRRFVEERERHALRMHCEDCALFDDRAERCAHGFPTDEHRAPRPGRELVAIVFCKDFELA